MYVVGEDSKRSCLENTSQTKRLAGIDISDFKLIDCCVLCICYLENKVKKKHGLLVIIIGPFDSLRLPHMNVISTLTIYPFRARWYHNFTGKYPFYVIAPPCFLSPPWNREINKILNNSRLDQLDQVQNSRAKLKMFYNSFNRWENSLKPWTSYKIFP